MVRYIDATFKKWRNSYYFLCKNNPQFIEQWMQLDASVNHERTLNSIITAVLTDRICEWDLVGENHDSTNLSDIFKSTALRVAVGKATLVFLLLYGPNVNMPFARLSFYCCRIWRQKHNITDYLSYARW